LVRSDDEHCRALDLHRAHVGRELRRDRELRPRRDRHLRSVVEGRPSGPAVVGGERPRLRGRQRSRYRAILAKAIHPPHRAEDDRAANGADDQRDLPRGPFRQVGHVLGRLVPEALDVSLSLGAGHLRVQVSR
jgi:hypothetical protein